MGVMIEHFAGNFPLWLSPMQVVITPIGEKQLEYAEQVLAALKQADIRATIDLSKDSVGKRIREAKGKKVPYVIVLGDKEKDAGVLTVETRGEKIENITPADFVARLRKEVVEKL